MGQPLYKTQEEKLKLEARNGLFLFDETINLYKISGNVLNFNSGIIKRLHSITVRAIYTCGGSFREHNVTIKGSLHKPPEYKYVPAIVDDMCIMAKANIDWKPTKTAERMVDLAVELDTSIWWRKRPNFSCLRLLGLIDKAAGPVAWETGPIPEQIVNERRRYQEALEDADASWRGNSVNDVSHMKNLLDELLEVQLSYLEEADEC